MYLSHGSLVPRKKDAAGMDALGGGKVSANASKRLLWIHS